MIERTDAIVLNSIDYSDTSNIVSMYTRTRGRISVIAKGARRPKSRFGSSLLPMSYVEAVYYYRAGRGLQTLKECSHAARMPRISEEIDRLHVGFRIIELVRSLTVENDQNQPLFNLVVQSLLQLDLAAENVGNVLPHFQLNLATILGFAPDIRREDLLAVTAASGYLELSSGAVSAERTNGAVRASRESLRAFAIFARTDLATCLRLRLTDAQLSETVRLADMYLRHQVDVVYSQRSIGVFEHLRRGPREGSIGKPS